MTAWDLPLSLEVGGRAYRVNADYRDMLDLMARLNGPEEDERTRLYIALALFYEDLAQMPQEDYGEAVRRMFWFINGGRDEAPARPQPKVIDWEQDGSLIVADVNRVAGCEVRSLQFCHWWTFLAWFQGIGEGQLSTVVSIREKRRRGKKLEAWEREFYQEHREMVDFKKRYTDEEREEQERLKRRLGE